MVRVSIPKKKAKYLLGVVPGDKYVGLDRLSQLVGGTKAAAYASRDVAERLTAGVSVSIPPFCFNLELQLIVDKNLLITRRYFSTQHDWTSLSPFMWRTI